MVQNRWFKRMSVLLIIMIMAVMPTPKTYAADVIRVAPGGSTDPDCGADWTTPCALQTALGRALPEDEIWVREGVYRPGTSVESTFLIPPDVALYGGFTGTELARDERDWLAHPTVLSGDIGGDDLDPDDDGVIADWEDMQGANAYHVVTFDTSTTAVSPATLIDGVVVTAGRANGSGVDDRGGGLYCPFVLGAPSCSPTLVRVLVSGNRAAQGGGMFIQSAGGGENNPTLTHMTFRGNRANAHGGGLYTQNGSHPVLTSVVFEGNHADKGGGLWSGSNQAGAGVTVTGGEFVNNYAEQNGGGAYLFADRLSQAASFSDVVFRGNEANIGGGLVDNTAQGGGFVSLTRLTFEDNHAFISGGGIAFITENWLTSNSTEDELDPNLLQAAFPPPQLVDSTFRNNQADGRGGGLYNHNHGLEVVVRGVVFAGNEASQGGGAACTTDGLAPCRLTLENVLFSGNYAVDQGGGLFQSTHWGGTAEVVGRNVTFGGNEAGYRGGAVATMVYYDGLTPLDLVNCIIWGNTASDHPSIWIAYGQEQDTVLRYSLIEGWPNDEANNLWGDRDPLYVAPAAESAPTTGGNYRLQLISPALDTGDNLSVPEGVTTDLDGNPRFVDVPSAVDAGNGDPPIVDPGAYEHSGELEPDPTPTPTTTPSAMPTLTSTPTPVHTSTPTAPPPDVPTLTSTPTPTPTSTATPPDVPGVTPIPAATTYVYLPVVRKDPTPTSTLESTIAP